MRYFTTCALLARTWATARADDAVLDLLRRFPGTANTVAVVNVKAVRDAAGKSNAAVIAGSVFDPSVDLVVYATHLEPDAVGSQPMYGLVRFNRPISPKRSASIRRRTWPTSTAATPGTPRRSTTSRLPTSRRRSASARVSHVVTMHAGKCG